MTRAMIIGLLILLLGIFLIASHPLLGLIPGLLLIVVGIVVMVLGGLARGAGAILNIGSSKTCPQCGSRIPASARVCRVCGYRYS